MSISLNKQQLRQTLREMGVGYPADADEDDLREILERENDRLWLNQAHGKGARPGARVIRKRRDQRAPAVENRKPGKDGDKPREKPAPPRQKPAPRKTRNREAAWGKRSRDFSRPAPDLAEPPPEREDRHGAPIFDPDRDVDGYALRRANGICDLCETPVERDSNGKPVGLSAYYFGQHRGGEARSLKTVVALCSPCLDKVRAAPRPADIKKLTRKARGKLIPGVSVQTRRRTPPVKRK
ncbi:MAG: hypothetical protein GY859_02550 [Desulfobacterales bacterium]|nr:hypothetical protein [Desulfobacterales bacterium]